MMFLNPTGPIQCADNQERKIGREKFKLKVFVEVIPARGKE